MILCIFLPFIKISKFSIERENWELFFRCNAFEDKIFFLRKSFIIIITYNLALILLW